MSSSRVSPELERELARASPAGFAYVASRGKWIPARHLLLIADKLCAIARGEIDRLMVFMPPRSGKSQLISEYTPPWYLGCFPDRRIILASYGASLASTWGRRARNLLTEYGPTVFDLEVDNESKAADRWDIAGHTGGMITAGVGGPISGRGAHCLPGETLVSTEAGPIPISALAHMRERPRALVASQGEERYQSIIAAQVTVTDELYEITTDSGHRLRATGRHRIFIPERGYVEAARLRPGDRLTVLQESAQRDVREVWRGEGRPGDPLPQVLRRGAAGRGDDHLRVVRAGGDEEGVRLAQGAEVRVDGCVLLSRVLPRAPRDKDSPPLRNLRRAVSEEDDAVLLSEVQAREPAGGPEGMPELHVGVPAARRSADVLLKAVRERGALQAHARRGQLPLQGRDQLREVVHGDATIDLRARRAPMLALFDGGRARDCDPAGLEAPADAHDAGDPSHRRGSAKQRSGESGHALPEMPHDAAQVSSATIVAVERVRVDREPVYDLQVEGPNHFFADGVLVHNCLIIDDPVKNAEEAASEVIREKQLDWWRSVARTRLMPGGAVVLLQTRWHEGDLAGALLADMQEGGDQWEVLSLPALAEDETDALGRAPGEALWPAFFDEEALLRTKRSIGGYFWSALYQQRPAPAEGFLFKRKDFRYWRLETNMIGAVMQRLYVLAEDDGTRRFDAAPCPLFQTVDAAISEKEQADWTVVATWAATPDGDLLLLDLERKHFEEQQTVEFLAAANDKHGRPPMWIERFGAGRNPLARLGARGHPVMEIPPEAGAQMDKVTRAFGAIAVNEQHKLFLPRPEPDWLGAYLTELGSFPNATHDDQVDVTSYAARLLPLMHRQRAQVRTGSGPRPHSAGIRSQQF